LTYFLFDWVVHLGTFHQVFVTKLAKFTGCLHRLDLLLQSIRCHTTKETIVCLEWRFQGFVTVVVPFHARVLINWSGYKHFQTNSCLFWEWKICLLAKLQFNKNSLRFDKSLKFPDSCTECVLGNPNLFFKSIYHLFFYLILLQKMVR